MIYKMFKRTMDIADSVEAPLACCLIANIMPRNLRQYYADRLMLMIIELQYGK